MRKSFLNLTIMFSIGAVAATAQQPVPQPGNNGTTAGENLPPGLQNREQLPPGLEKRDTLPPGLQRRTGDQTLDQDRQTTTNIPGRLGTNLSRWQTNFSRFGTNAYNSVSNAYTSLTNRYGSTNLAPTGGLTNRIYSTNSVSVTNRTTVSMQDQAATPADKRLLVQIQQNIRPIFVQGNVGTQAWMPVHFRLQEGVVTVVGYVPNAEQKQRVIEVVERVPGVVRVVDQLQVNVNETAATSTVESALQPGIMVQDQAITSTDQTLVVRLREQIQPVIGGSVPVHFIARQGVVTLTGFVRDEQQKEQIAEVVRGTPGVVQIVNQLQVNAQAAQGGRAAGMNLTNGLAGSPGQTTNLTGGALQTNLYSRTNLLGGNMQTNDMYRTNSTLSPTGRTNVNQRIQRDTLPPGLQKRDELPPGLQKDRQSDKE